MPYALCPLYCLPFHSFLYYILFFYSLFAYRHMCRIWLNRNLIRCTIWLCYSGDMFMSAGMSQWPSMFTRPSGELRVGRGRGGSRCTGNCLAWLPLCCCCCCGHGRGSWGNYSFQMVCGLFWHRFVAALRYFFSPSHSLCYAWLRALWWEGGREREISIHLHSLCVCALWTRSS